MPPSCSSYWLNIELSQPFTQVLSTFMQASKEPPIIPENVVKTETAVEANLKEAAQSPITVAQSPMKAVRSPIAVAQSPVAVVQVPDVVRPDSYVQFLAQISKPNVCFDLLVLIIYSYHKP